MIQGTIYKITSPHTTKCYIGSTIRPLKKRWSQHKNSGTGSSQHIIKAGDASIECLESVTVDSKYALEDLEAKYILSNREQCVNLTIPGGIRRVGGKSHHQKMPMFCPCGAVSSRRNFSRHKKSNRCKAYHANNPTTSDTLNST